MARFRGLPRSLRLGFLALALLGGLTTYAWAQGVGIFSRNLCTSLTSPVAGQTFCFEQSTNTLKFYTGSATAPWVNVTATEAGTNNVRDFGATGNGTTDDTVAIQAAISSGTGTILFPPGIYKTTATINMTNAVRLIGMGAGPGGNSTCGDNSENGTIWEHQFNGTAINIIGVNGNVLAGVGPTIENILFRQCAGTGTGNQGSAIAVTKTSDTYAPSWVRIRNVTCEQGTGKDDWAWCMIFDGSGAATGPQAGGGLRDIWIENIRTVSGTNATGAMSFTSVANLFLSLIETNLTNGHVTITGPSAAKASAVVHMNHVSIAGTLTLDQAISVKATGGIWTTLTTTANASALDLQPMNLVNTPTFNAANSLLLAGTLSATGAPAVWAPQGWNFRTQTVSWTGVANPVIGPTDANNLNFTTNGNTRGSFAATTGLFSANNGVLINGTPGSFSAGQLYKDATLGLVIGTITGSSSDLDITTPAGNAIIQVPTGTQGIKLPGTAGLQVGSPTGGDKGSGAINAAAATGYYQNGTAISTVTMKSGSGAGNYTTTSAAYADIDGTNLAFTVTVPTGFKMLINAHIELADGNLGAASGVALTDGTTVLTEAFTVQAVATDNYTTAMTYVFTGDGASHTFKLRWQTSVGTLTGINSSSTRTPRMTFLMVPSS